MSRRQTRKPRPPLDQARLAELGLAYVGRFATTRAKLASYLRRKIAERGWADERGPDIDSLVERWCASGYVDDAAYALAKSRALAARGYGAGRLRQALHAAGVGEADGSAAREQAAGAAVEAALCFARRRRLGPFADVEPDRRGREKAIAAMLRAGHSFELARAVVDLKPGAAVDPADLSTLGVS